MERLDFGTDPVDERPRILAEADVRRAIASCIDREALIDEVVTGLSPVPSGMIASGHPLASSASSLDYDPAAARESLTALGWVDEDGQPSTPRVAQGVDDVSAGTPLSLTLMTAAGSTEAALARAIADELAQCGVQIEVEDVPAETLYAPWPDGPVFGRRFDLVAWPWLGWIGPACELFTTGEIASDSFGEGSNASGFSDASYDNACARARLGPVADGAYSEAIQETQTILDEAVPSLPLFQWPRLLVAGEGVCGLDLDPTAALLWNLEALSPGPPCVP
jgi:peptide/nickel transport system substrate-binding protein